MVRVIITSSQSYSKQKQDTNFASSERLYDSSMKKKK